MEAAKYEHYAYRVKLIEESYAILEDVVNLVKTGTLRKWGNQLLRYQWVSERTEWSDADSEYRLRLERS